MTTHPTSSTPSDAAQDSSATSVDLDKLEALARAIKEADTFSGTREAFDAFQRAATAKTVLQLIALARRAISRPDRAIGQQADSERALFEIALRKESSASLTAHDIEQAWQGGLGGLWRSRAALAQPVEAKGAALKCRYCNGEGEHHQERGVYADCNACGGTGKARGGAAKAPAAQAVDAPKPAFIIRDFNAPEGLVTTALSLDAASHASTPETGSVPASPAQPDTTASASGEVVSAASIMELAEQAKKLPRISTIAPIPLTPIQIAFIAGKLADARRPTPAPAQHVVAVDERQQAHVLPPTRGTGSQHDTSTKVLTDDEMLVIADENDYAEEDPKCIVRLCRAVEDKAIRRFRAQGGNTNDSAPLAQQAAAPILTLENAPIGTTAPADGGGRWYRVAHGWKWNGPDGNGGVFPRPGGDWNGKLIAPASAPAAAHEAGRTVYTCIGKGGRYRLLGLATGAGASRGQPDLRVYMAEDNPLELYYRTVADFDSRMAAAGAAGQEGGGK
jgi:hypothetical protein